MILLAFNWLVFNHFPSFLTVRKEIGIKTNKVVEYSDYYNVTSVLFGFVFSEQIFFLIIIILDIFLLKKGKERERNLLIFINPRYTFHNN